MPGGADGKRVSRRRAFPKASKRNGPDRSPACRTPQDKTQRLCTRAVRAAGISCGSPRRCGLRFACGRRFACVPPLCQCTAVLLVCRRFTCALLPCLCAAALPVRCCLVCVRTAALLVCLRFSFVSPPCLCAAGTYCPLGTTGLFCCFSRKPLCGIAEIRP